MRSKLSLAALIVLILSCGDAMTKSKQPKISTDAEGPEKFHVVFYNVENLFDTQDDPKKLDDDFTPEGKKNWSDNRYDRKIAQLTKVIQTMRDRHDYIPAVIGLAEVENKKVVEDLAQSISTKEYTYKVIHEESNDRRGIDVAMMYRSDIFSEVDHEALKIKFDNRSYNSRDILHAKMKLYDGEIVNFYLNHWPSRREGAQESEPRRLAAAHTLRKNVDKVLDKDKNANIIILGDFNDYPDNKSIHSVLGASGDMSETSDLYNLAYKLNDEDKGTYNYRGDWGMLDQAIVSQSFFDAVGLRTSDDELYIFDDKFLTYYDKKYKINKPSATYGYKYYGGYSDHFPIVLQLSVK